MVAPIYLHLFDIFRHFKASNLLSFRQELFSIFIILIDRMHTTANISPVKSFAGRMELPVKLNSLKSIILALLLTLSVSTVFASGFSETTVQWLSEKGFSPVLIILIISMLPLIELRGSIPVAILLFKMSWQEALILSLIGNMLPIPLILLFMDWFFESISRFPLGKRFTNWLFTRTRRKGKAIERYEAIGLAIFVGIPLPGTGA
mgnify:CR=1 FL=1